MSIASDARFWDKSSRGYARSRIADPNGYERTLERARAHLQPGDSVLELGCGTGTTALRLADGVRSYLATDISGGMIAIAEEKLAVESIPALSFAPRPPKNWSTKKAGSMPFWVSTICIWYATCRARYAASTSC